MLEERMLSRKEVAEYLGACKDTLYRWGKEKPPRIPMRKIGKRFFYRKSDVDKFIEDSLVK